MIFDRHIHDQNTTKRGGKTSAIDKSAICSRAVGNQLKWIRSQQKSELNVEKKAKRESIRDFLCREYISRELLISILVALNSMSVELEISSGIDKFMLEIMQVIRLS